MAEVALDHGQWHAGVYQAGRAGVAEVVGAADLQATAVVVAQVGELDERAQLGVQGLHGVGAVPVAVHVAGDEQVPGRHSGEAAGGHLSVRPLLLGADDRDGVGVDQDCVGRVADLGLLIAELGDEPVVGVGARESGERQHRVSIDHQNLAESAAGGSDEHQDPHRLLVSEAALLGRVAEQLDPSHDPAHRRVIDDFCLVDACGGAGLLGKR